MSQLLIELCTILIEETLGERPASLWQHIADTGRSTFKDLLASSNLGHGELARLITVLLQHRCLNYFVDREYDSAYYSVDVDGAYNLLRLSRMIDVVRKRSGPDAAAVMSTIAQFGQITVSELTALYDTHMPTISSEQLHATILKLLRTGFLIRGHPRFSQNPYDIEQELERDVIEQEFSGKRVTGPVSSRNFRDAVHSRKRMQHERDYANLEFLSQPIPDTTHPAKRRKISMTNGHHDRAREAGEALEGGLILYVNTKKYLIALRSQHLERRAAIALGPSAGAVYGSLLRTLERQIHDVKQMTTATINYDSDDDDDGVIVAPSVNAAQQKTTVMEMISTLPPNLDFTTSIKVATKDLPKKQGNGYGGLGKLHADEDDFESIGIKQEPASDTEDESGDEFRDLANRAKLYELLNTHLDLLAEHSFAFCSRVIHKNPPEYQVDFPTLTEKLVLAEIDTTISARFGTPATRIVRLLRDKGKLEEKQISSLSYMPTRVVRSLLTELFASGFVDAQELAKDNQRQPSKALYLWYFDINKVRSTMLQQCYHAMCRTYQRMMFERQRYTNIIHKLDDFVRDKLFERRAMTVQLGAEDAGQTHAKSIAHGDGSSHAASHSAHKDLDKIDEDGDLQMNGLHSSDTRPGEDQSDRLIQNSTASRRQEMYNSHGPYNLPKHVNGELLDADEKTGHQATAIEALENNSAKDSADQRSRSKFIIDMTSSALISDFSTNSLEKQQYREWKKQETLLLGHILRLDDLVVLLRDL